MTRQFTGRALLPGNTSGEAVVTTHGFNSLASYKKSALKKSKRVICSDQDNPDLYKVDLTDKILCLPKTIGSTTGGLVIMTAADLGLAPRAMLFSQQIDSLAAAGVILSDIWNGLRIITVDRLGDDFLEYVTTGASLTVSMDGVVTVTRKSD
jgi:predicted aconitase with swiveling domain